MTIHLDPQIFPATHESKKWIEFRNLTTFDCNDKYINSQKYCSDPFLIRETFKILPEPWSICIVYPSKTVVLDLINADAAKIISDGPPTDEFDRNDRNVSIATQVFQSRDGEISVIDFDGSIYVLPTANMSHVRLSSPPFMLVGSAKDCPIKPIVQK